MKLESNFTFFFKIFNFSLETETENWTSKPTQFITFSIVFSVSAIGNSKKINLEIIIFIKFTGCQIEDKIRINTSNKPFKKLCLYC